LPRTCFSQIVVLFVILIVPLARVSVVVNNEELGRKLEIPAWKRWRQEKCQEK
jgi:hypothetical protein